MVVAVEIGIYREKKVNRNLDDMLRLTTDYTSLIYS